MDNNTEDLRNFHWWLRAISPAATCEINRVREIETLRKRRQYILSIIPKPLMDKKQSDTWQNHPEIVQVQTYCESMKISRFLTDTDS